MARVIFISYLLIVATITSLNSQTPNTNTNKFRQLYQELPTPNVYRNAAGAPGFQYWQNKADYMMDIRIEDETQRLYGNETITYTNNSPEPLTYLWLQLDQNVRALDSDSYKIRQSKLDDRMTMGQIKSFTPTFDGGFKIESVTAQGGEPLSYTIVQTMMRVDLPEPLQSGSSYSFSIRWWYNINNRDEVGGRSGYEYFEADDNYLYTIAQFFPRMCMYNDVDGWQNKQFLGRGEFTLSFGDYDVRITVPSDHYVAATGELQNPKNVLTKTELNRLDKASASTGAPVVIVTQEEAEENEKEKSTDTKTWSFKATNVRDFAFASSRKFIWDAMAVEQQDGSTVMAMSMYPKEGNPLWGQYSTQAVAHTIKWYSHYTFNYPYPVAWSIHTDRIGMEYPMICFNGGRPEPDGTYSERTKYGMISVIIHEVGHNYFPMIVNSDERQWTWMDEGLNTFLQFLTEQQWERNYPSRRGPAHKIVPYMSSSQEMLSPIMTNSESIFQFGNNAYGKPATALNILRESIMGRELFDYAFKVYSNRWKFRNPTPADFFRTMEDASAIDLDWFWRAWFFTTDYVDIAIEQVRWMRVDTKNPDIENPITRTIDIRDSVNISAIRNRQLIRSTQDEIDSTLRDFYTDYDPLDVTEKDRANYQAYLNTLSDEDRAFLNDTTYFYEISFKNVGGIPMPIFIEFTFMDGSTELHRIPAEIWKMDDTTVTKVFPTGQEVKEFTLDPFFETADTDTGNNYFPPRHTLDRFELFQSRSRGQRGTNPMRENREE